MLPRFEELEITSFDWIAPLLSLGEVLVVFFF